jgi:hypothetical protein
MRPKTERIICDIRTASVGRPLKPIVLTYQPNVIAVPGAAGQVAGSHGGI